MSVAELSDPEDSLLPNDVDDEIGSNTGGYASDEAIEDNSNLPENGNDSDNPDGSGQRRIDPSTSGQKRIVRNPQPKLDAERLKGPKGVHMIEKHFENFKFEGKGCEKKDLDRMMNKLEYWAHRIFPKYEFDDFLGKVEVLGNKKAVKTHLTKIRLGMLTDEEVALNDVMEEEDEPVQDSAPIDEFDALIAEELEKQRHSVTPQRPHASIVSSNSNAAVGKAIATSHPDITDEMKERMERNRQLAIQKRLARIKAEEAKKIALEREVIGSQEDVAPMPNQESTVTDSIGE
ncbi:protein TIPIN homolog [Neodiprion lecontei]|uniref:TIMELESS-interacting protein n=1 Tax=Neodiprion lecontei TaxID=441921 RepID=A0A6J0BYA1_NEOLC|nr:protein TIPIN homolog [Neodiprion lecontei]